MSDELSQQTKNAFDFVQKLYFETSYLIKEIEGLLQEEEERFMILKPAGYSISTRSSTGLEPINVEMWLMKNFTVFFTPENMTEYFKGQTITKFQDDLKIIVVHISLYDKERNQPMIIFGCIRDIVSKNKDIKKFEHALWEFTYNLKNVLSKSPNIDHDDKSYSFKGELKLVPLYSISNSDKVRSKIIEPLLELYRK
ncbi:MAG: hypothetical protein M1371_10240 [Actinobacteria bacterium]|nr:hypothetical protein [Actinomycetota bacterium]MCL5986921.1 hypothetical protein [Actinomycetota bacterium]